MLFESIEMTHDQFGMLIVQRNCVVLVPPGKAIFSRISRGVACRYFQGLKRATKIIRVSGLKRLMRARSHVPCGSKRDVVYLLLDMVHGVDALELTEEYHELGFKMFTDDFDLRVGCSLDDV